MRTGSGNTVGARIAAAVVHEDNGAAGIAGLTVHSGQLREDSVRDLLGALGLRSFQSSVSILLPMMVRPFC